MKKIIIGIAGVKGVGKSTWAKKYQQSAPNSTRMAFADGLKDLVCQLLGITRTELEQYKNREHAITGLQYNYSNWISIISKEVGCDESFIKEKLDKQKMFTSVRNLLQWLGTDVIREFNVDWHTDNLTKKVMESTADIIFIDDVRFPNEKQLIEDLGGFCLYLRRDSVTSNASDTHASETSLTEDMFNPQEVVIVEDLANPDQTKDDDLNEIISRFI